MKINNRIWFLAVIAVFLTIAVYGFIGMMSPEFRDDITGNAAPPLRKSGKTYYIGVVSRFAPSILYKGYQPIVDYLNRETPYRFKLKLSNSYEEAVKQLVEGETVAAFLGTYVFSVKMREYGLTALLAPKNDEGKPFFRVMLVTREDSPVKNPEDLKGRKIGVPNRLSFSGNWLRLTFPQSLLKEFRIVYYDFHHTVIQHIFREDVDAGVVKDRVAHEYLGKGIKKIRESEWIPASPLAGGPLSDQKVLAAITKALTRQSGGKYEDRENWDPEFKNGFVEVTGREYLALGKRILSNKTGSENPDPGKKSPLFSGRN